MLFVPDKLKDHVSTRREMRCNGIRISRAKKACAVTIVMLLCSLGFRFLVPNALAGGGPENTLIIINSDSDSSKLIANYYISLREIPDRNVVYLDQLPFKEKISLNEFRELILLPILGEIQKRKLVGSIDYIVYSSDIPTSIDVTEHRKMLDAAAKKTGKKYPRQLFNPTASITALTYFAGRIIENNPNYMQPNSNRYYRQPSDVVLRLPFVGDAMKEYQSAVAKIESPVDGQEFRQAISTLENLAKANPGQTAVYYWLAKFHAKNNDADSASKFLTRAIRMGWNDRGSTMLDTDFDSVKDDLLFKGLVDRMKNGGRHLATRGFRQLHQWAPNGMLNHEKGQGERYFLSTVLAITRNDGVTEGTAVEQLTASIAADFTKPRGAFYFCETSDVRSTTRKPNFEIAINALEELGYACERVKSNMPTKQKRVLGLTSGTSKFDWESTKSKIVPGAICENLTSFGGLVGVVGGQTKLTEFLKYGAAGSSGTVVEPYAVQAKFPHPLIHAHYARGCSLAEAFYQSIHGPFQTLVVGDALCQPFATPPVLDITGILPMTKLSGKVELGISEAKSPVPVAGIELFVNGILMRRDSSLDPIDLDTTQLPDGYHELRVVGVANDLIETRCRTIIPILIENNGYSTEISVEIPTIDVRDVVKVKAKSNFGNEIVIVHNRQEIGRIPSREGSCEIKAKLLGRGPVEIRAVAIDESLEKRKMVGSAPVELSIQGPYASELPRTAKPKPKKKPNAN